MDFIELKKRISAAATKYKYVWLVLLIGIGLMLLPETQSKKESMTAEEVAQSDDLQMQLEEILGFIKGAGQVKVMLSVAQGERTIYQTDSEYTQDDSRADSRTQTVLITDSQRNETGLIHQKNPPTYQGAIVLAQGADDPSVKLAIVEAVSNVTGLGADKISVLKM